MTETKSWRKKRRVGALLMGLVFLTLLPRAWMGWKLDVICPDAALYIGYATALAEGNWPFAFSELNLNTLPVILVGLNHLGFPWELSGKLWSIAMSTAVVLPLFGWLRRQFDERTAIVACVLYAAHAELIEWSPEVLRDPTFWFLATLSIYFSQRATYDSGSLGSVASSERRPGTLPTSHPIGDALSTHRTGTNDDVNWGQVSIPNGTRAQSPARWNGAAGWVWYVAAGLAITLAALTRVEGLFLLAPLLWPILARLFTRRTMGVRRLAGTAAALAMLPIVLMAANCLWLRGEPQWQAFRAVPLKLAGGWLETSLGGQPVPGLSDDRASQEFWNLQHQQPISTRAAILASTVAQGAGLWFLCFAAIGMFVHRHEILHADNVALLLIALAVACGMWIHLWYAGVSSTRYPLLIVIVLLPWAARGALSLASKVRQLREARSFHVKLDSAPAPSLDCRLGLILLLGFLTVAGWTDALTNRYSDRRQQAYVGSWILQEFGPGTVMVSSERLIRLVGYHARGECHSLRDCRGLRQLQPFMRRKAATLLVLAEDSHGNGDYSKLATDYQRFGLRTLAVSIDDGASAIHVYVAGWGTAEHSHSCKAASSLMAVLLDSTSEPGYSKN